ncbi:hypothetical protein RchiOBHm_Chr5g0073991 [Rosa chinensis]|uniref:Uncharacterized protein n=1 Tax=Rosa chinensis TaxID=74649 RepID=A0A2P6QL33_ROSCH|nr:hypothetical protein RchiOBHm_Chr5g0073991 [Rosa chinensis]
MIGDIKIICPLQLHSFVPYLTTQSFSVSSLHVETNKLINTDEALTTVDR